jgi:predicted peroxiredoxin
MRTYRTTLMMLVLIGVLTIGVSACTPASGETADVGEPAMLFNITSGPDDAHAVSMGLSLATKTIEHGRPVTVFFNVKGAELPVKDLPDSVQHAEWPPVREMIETLVADGATVLVCPTCAKVAGVTEEDLLDGVAMATAETLFGGMPEGAIALSY